MKELRFLSNTYNPYSPNAKAYFRYPNEAAQDPGLAGLEWRNWLNWIAKNHIGRPVATDKYSVEELERMGMVGVYSDDENTILVISIEDAGEESDLSDDLVQ